jgi:hypothetical protein
MLSRVEVGLSFDFGGVLPSLSLSPPPFWVWERHILTWKGVVIVSVRIALYNHI